MRVTTATAFSGRVMSTRTTANSSPPSRSPSTTKNEKSRSVRPPPAWTSADEPSSSPSDTTIAPARRDLIKAARTAQARVAATIDHTIAAPGVCPACGCPTRTAIQSWNAAAVTITGNSIVSTARKARCRAANVPSGSRMSGIILSIQAVTPPRSDRTCPAEPNHPGKLGRTLRPDQVFAEATAGPPPCRLVQPCPSSAPPCLGTSVASPPVPARPSVQPAAGGLAPSPAVTVGPAGRRGLGRID
jgi:hypothetical protein